MEIDGLMTWLSVKFKETLLAFIQFMEVLYYCQRLSGPLIHLIAISELGAQVANLALPLFQRPFISGFHFGLASTRPFFIDPVLVGLPLGLVLPVARWTGPCSGPSLPSLGRREL